VITARSTGWPSACEATSRISLRMTAEICCSVKSRPAKRTAAEPPAPSTIS